MRGSDITIISKSSHGHISHTKKYSHSELVMEKWDIVGPERIIRATFPLPKIKDILQGVYEFLGESIVYFGNKIIFFTKKLLKID